MTSYQTHPLQTVIPTFGTSMIRKPRQLLIACGALLAGPWVSGIQAQSTTPEPILIRAEKAWLEPGKSLERARFTIRGDEISEVVQYGADSEAGATEITGAVLTAGFIDLHNTLGPASQLSERIESFTPELRADKAYDPFDALWKRVLAQGITSLVYAPNNSSIAGGQAILLRPGLRPKKNAAATYLKFSLTKAAQTSYKRPTSLVGALEYLRENYRNLRSRAPRQLSAAELILASTVGGNTSVGIACNRAEEILSALELSKEENLESFLILGGAVGTWDPRMLDDVLPDLAKNNKRLLLPALDMRSNKRAQALPARLDKLGIPFAFSAASDRNKGINPIQWTLAMAMRAGLSADKALAAVTTTPAAWCGIDQKTGSLYKGRQADLCLWSGEPWDLRSRLLLVVRAGKIVYDSRKTDSRKANATMEARR
jgi:imidazolonepropionase-like amidohydrolase